ncbi:hypothetical protein J3F84DRAFT_358783 [Trichoderma pleuroticola]
MGRKPKPRPTSQPANERSQFMPQGLSKMPHHAMLAFLLYLAPCRNRLRPLAAFAVMNTVLYSTYILIQVRLVATSNDAEFHPRHTRHSIAAPHFLFLYPLPYQGPQTTRSPTIEQSSHLTIPQLEVVIPLRCLIWPSPSPERKAEMAGHSAASEPWGLDGNDCRTLREKKPPLLSPERLVGWPASLSGQVAEAFCLRYASASHVGSGLLTTGPWISRTPSIYGVLCAVPVIMMPPLLYSRRLQKAV